MIAEVRDEMFNKSSRFCWNPKCDYLVPATAPLCTKCGWTATGPSVPEPVRPPVLPPDPIQPPVIPPGPADQEVVTIHADPMGAVRIVQSDKWKTDPNHKDPKRRARLCVARYFAYKDLIKAECAKQGYTLGNDLHIRFDIAMPASWSKKKRAEMLGKPHRQKPDTDNLVKAFKDAFGEDDSHVTPELAYKFWAEKGRITVFRTFPHQVIPVM